MNVDLNKIKRYNNNFIKGNAQYEAAMKAYDCVYEGVNLENKFADEIAQVGNVYKWLDGRIKEGNYEGIHVGDYFHTSIKAGIVGATEKYSIKAQIFKCRIVGINTYKSCTDKVIGNMIYVNSDELLDTTILWNPTENNNGTEDEEHPWLASAMYAVLNGVNNYSTNAYNNVAHGADCSTGGILQLLPPELQAVIKQKRTFLDKRYSSSGLLTGGNSSSFEDMGKLWLPTEIEVYGAGYRSNLSLTPGYYFPEACTSIQFPWYAFNCEHRIKKQSNGVHRGWWLSSAAGFHTAFVCLVDATGFVSSTRANYNAFSLPLCFCI